MAFVGRGARCGAAARETAGLVGFCLIAADLELGRRVDEARSGMDVVFAAAVEDGEDGCEEEGVSAMAGDSSGCPLGLCTKKESAAH